MIPKIQCAFWLSFLFLTSCYHDSECNQDCNKMNIQIGVLGEKAFSYSDTLGFRILGFEMHDISPALRKTSGLQNADCEGCSSLLTGSKFYVDAPVLLGAADTIPTQSDLFQLPDTLQQSGAFSIQFKKPFVLAKGWRTLRFISSYNQKPIVAEARLFVPDSLGY